MADWWLTIVWWSFWGFVGIVILVSIIWEWHFMKGRELVWDAQDMELEAGITLRECVRVYYGRDTDRWDNSGKFVYVTAGGWDRPRVNLRVNPKAGKIENRQAGKYRNNGETEALLRDMVAEVKRRRTGAW